MLLRSGCQFVKYSFRERIIEANKEQYYSALRHSQKDLKSTPYFQDIWTEFFFDLLKKQKDELDRKIQRERKALVTPFLSAQILDLARQHGRVSIAFLFKSLDVNRNTIKKHVQALVKQERLLKNGQGRGSYYTQI